MPWPKGHRAKTAMLSVRLTPEDLEALKKTAAAELGSPSPRQVVQGLIQDYLAKSTREKTRRKGTTRGQGHPDDSQRTRSPNAQKAH